MLISWGLGKVVHLGLLTIAQYSKSLTDIAFNESGEGVIATFSDGTLVHGTMIIGADGPKSKVREFAMGSAEKAAVTKFPIFHTNMTVCYNDAEKARFVRQRYPTSYLALSQRSFHAFQSSERALVPSYLVSPNMFDPRISFQHARWPGPSRVLDFPHGHGLAW